MIMYKGADGEVHTCSMLMTMFSGSSSMGTAQNLTATPNDDTQVIKADAGHYLNSVTINPVPSETYSRNDDIEAMLAEI